MGINVQGVDKLNRWLTDAGGKIDKESIGVLRRAAVRVRRKQKQLAPKDEGDLRKSISYRIRGTRWRRVAHIGPRLSAKYPLYQETGTGKMEANPYIAPSVQGEDEQIAADLARMMGGLG